MSFTRGMASIIESINNGKTWTTRFLKNYTSQFATGWMDSAFAGGQPVYDARVGTALAFTPAVATGNDAIWFPPIPADSERYLVDCNFRSNQIIATAMMPVIVYDMLGYYPLIDGDSTDLQELDNTQTLPRYTDGIGVQMVLVNHVAPQAQTGTVTIVFIDANDVQQTVTVAITAPSNSLVVGRAVTSLDTSTSYGSPFIRLDGGQKGVKRVISVQFGTTPGGLYAMYLVKPLMNIGNTAGTPDNNLNTNKSFTQNGLIAPRIYDGASLSWFSYRSGSNTQNNWFGDFTFVWT